MAKLLDLSVYGPGHISNILQVDASVYAKAFITDGGKDTQVVRGDGTLASISSLSVGNADTVDNKHASDFALLKTWNNLIHSGNEFTFVSGAYSGQVWLNYRTASGSTDGNITEYIFGNGKGGSLASITNGRFSGTAAKADYAANADQLDGIDSSSFAIWRGDANTDSTTSDVSSTSTADFFAKINATSGLFNSRFGAMRGSWWYAGNTQLDTGVGTLEMAGTAVLNLGSFTDTTDTYKSLLFLDQSGRLWSYTANETAVRQWSRYAKTSDIKDPVNYYWANVKVSSSSSESTTPTFGSTAINGTLTSMPNKGASSDQTYTYTGGGYYANNAPNIRLIGDNTYGISTIEFISQKGSTTINKPSDCGFIQFLPYGVSTLSVIGTAPTLNSSGELARLVIGVNNDATDQVWLQTPSGDGLRHIVGTGNYRVASSYDTYVSSKKGYIHGTEITYVNDADKVDGYHAGLANGSVAIYVPFPNTTTLKSEGYISSSYGTDGYGHPDNEFLQGICKWAIATYPNKGYITLMGSISPNSSGTCILHLYSSSGKDSTTNLPRWCRGQYMGLGGTLFQFGTVDYVWSYGQISAGYAGSAPWSGITGKPSTFAPSSHSHDYLPLSGGTMTGSPYIYLPASANNTALTDSTPTGLTYGRFQSYGTMTICGDTDGSTTEYVNITAGYSIANATAANGLSIGYSTLKWKGNTIWHAGNDGHGSGLDADTVDGVHLSSIIYAPTPGSVATGTSEETGRSSDVTRTSFWRDNNLGRIGLTVLHSDSAGYGWTINAGYSGTRFYTNIKTNGTWNSTEQTIAFLSDIPTVNNYYWANVNVSSSSNSATTPTFGNITTENISPKASNTYNIGSNGNEYATGDIRAIYARHIDSARSYTGDTNLYIQYLQKGNTLMQVNGGNVGIGTAAPTHKLHVAGSAKVGGNLLVGADASTNYIAFYGTNGDNPGSYNHTYIGENIWGTPESSELVLYKGNDIGTSATTVSSSGADRIRHIAGAHLFQIYKTALSGTFDSICKSTVPVNMLAIHQESIETYASLYVGGALNVNGGSDLNLRASSSTNTDPGDIVFTNSSGSELARLWKPSSVNDLYVRFGSSDSSKIILNSGNFTTHLDGTYVNVTGDTMTGALTLPANGLIVNSAGGDTAKRVIKAYGAAASNSGVYYLNFGDNPSSGNCGEIGFTYSSSGSTSNKIAMGFYGGNYLTYYYNGSSPGTLTVGTSSNYHAVLTSGNTYVTSGYGVINGTTITQVSNSDTVDGHHADSFLQRLRRTNLNASSSYSGMVPPDILSFKNGYPLYTDPEFASGNNSISVYNNSGGSAVTITRETSTTSGNSSGYCLHIKSAASGASPNGGGWYFATGGTQARVSVCVFRANIPVGYNVEWHSNSIGDGASNGWLTATDGTGKYEWYAYMVEWGASPSSTFFFTLNKAATVDWYLSYANVIDISKASYDGLRTRYSDYATSAGNADTLDGYHYNSFAWSSHSHNTLETYFKFISSDVTEAAVNLSTSTVAHTMTFYRNGISIPYQMDNSNDGGLLRVRGTTESNVIYEMATWDDSGAGETIQFNYYPTTSAATPTYSVSVPKKSGTIALTSDIPASSNYAAAGHTHTSFGSLTLSGDLNLSAASGNDSGDIVWKYTNGNEKSRIWTDNAYTSGIGPNYRVYNESGTALYTGRLATIGEVAAKVSKAGDTMTGTLDTCYSAGTWVSGMSYAAIRFNGLTAIDSNSFWRFFNMKSSGGHVVCYGGLGNNIGFYGYYSGRTANGTDWSFVANTANGNWTATASIYAASFYENSDIKLKKDVRSILTSANIPEIKEFKWKRSNNKSYGLIAQELESMGYSELVDIKDDGYKSVNYTAAHSLIIGKLQLKIKELEDRIKYLESK